ncbi:MAG TPA: hypothetical protein VI485_09690 [Vicinamibacterales bacterium]|nr:hypothetical protein [Vicinamibacterales bacterium]
MTGGHVLATVLALSLVAAVLTAPAFGQTSGLQQRLAKATSLNCTFPVIATGTWESGTPMAKTAAAKLTVTFKNINVDEGTADTGSALSASASSLVVVRYSNDYLHLMQSQHDGPLYTTTVIARETKEGRLMAVHTRHEYTQISLPGFTSRPEMYVGDCTVTP